MTGPATPVKHMEPLEPISRQAYLDLLIETSRTGGFPSAELKPPDIPGEKPTINCLYRGPDGKRCGIGLLIPDDRYLPAMEGLGAFPVINSWPAAVIPVAGLRMSAGCDYSRVQEVHDGMAQDVLLNGTDWDHAAFVEKLRALECFKCCTFPEPV